MKRQYSILMAPITLLCAIILVTGCGTTDDDEKQNKLTLQNPLNINRVDEPVKITRDKLTEIVGSFPDDKFPVLQLENGEYIASQADDLTGDGKWDVLSILHSFQPSEKIAVSVTFLSKDSLPQYESRAHAYLGYRPNRQGDFKPTSNNVRPKDHEPQSSPYLYQFEGPGWESDLIAYRSYFDRRNGKDIFGKTKTGVFLDSIGHGEDYHSLQPWGMDVLKVGSSLGAGSIAMMKNGNLHRLGETGSAEFQLVADGPVRAIINIIYKGWNVEGTEYNITEQLSIWGGKRWYENQLTFSGNESDTLITGIVNMMNYPAEEITAHHNFNILATHASQSENNDILGMAILVPSKNFAGFGKAPEEGEGITKTNFTRLTRGDNNQYTYYFYTGWELENEGFKEKEYFKDQLLEEAQRLNAPITIAGSR